MEGEDRWMEGRGLMDGGERIDGWRGEDQWMEGRGSMNGRER